MKTFYKKLHRLGRLLLLGGLFVGHFPGFAQGPTIDPAFLAYSVTAEGHARQVLQQSTTQRVLLGTYSQVGTISIPNGLVRLQAGNNQVDPVFQTNTAGLNTTQIDRLIALPNDQLLLFSKNNALLTLGAVSRRGLLRLNANGTPDPTFNTGIGPGLGLNDVLVQPDGKLLLAGAFSQFNGQPVGRIIRLDANGTVDATFQPVAVAYSNGQYASLSKVTLQPDGKILIAGSFSSVQGQPAGIVARLLADGSFDASFSAASIPSNLSVVGMTVQADGKILIPIGINSGSATGYQPLIRLLPNGNPDPSFQTGTNFNGWFYGPALPNQPVVVEPGGTILVANYATAYNGQSIGRVVRLLPTGSLDTNYQTLQTSGPGGYESPTSLQLLANGELLTNYRLLNTNGTPDPGFDPQLKVPGMVFALARQADGKLLVGGYFTEIGGVPAGGIARLYANGTTDAAFTTAAASDGVVYDLAIQPDGNIVAGGVFSYMGGAPRQALCRLLPTGQADATFASTIQPALAGQTYAQVLTLALQANGNILLSGDFVFVPNGGANSRRTAARVFGSTGLLDVGFPDFYYFNISQFLEQPDGKILLVGQGQVGTASTTTLVQRVLADGTPDPGFVITPTSVTFERVRALVRDAQGRLYVGGQFAQFGNVPTSSVARLLPNGTPDATFATTLGSGTSIVYTLALQPNGRLLAGGVIPPFTGQAYGSVRLLPTGSTDTSYDPLAGPNWPVARLLVQPDGAIVAAGSFSSVGSQGIAAITRLLDANVLSVSNQQLAALTQAWPVPAHGQLHLRLDAASRPQRVALLDALGRVVLSQSIAQPEITLDIAALPTGPYVLQVQYASGPVARRVVLE